MTKEILLGFEVGSGKPVHIRLHHLAVFGMTQLSGKTTTLEALISRSGLRAIAFITKRGESGFTSYRLIPPYYRPRADWQYVEGLVNVALGEKVKYEPGMRWAIIKVAKESRNLKDVRRKAVELKEKARRQFIKQTLEKLIAYLDIVIPELEKYEFSERLELTDGVNVMDLHEMPTEIQQLVIASTIEYVFRNLTETVIIIPEAWEMIPQFKMTPVKWVAQQLIRKGAAVGNFIFLDSQDIGGIDKTPLRQVDNWLIGRMKEAHEVERMLKQLHGAKVKAEDIQMLPLGHFYVATGNRVVKAYVLPASVPEEVGRKVAMGQLSPEYVRDRFLKPKVLEGEDLVYKEKYETLKAEFDKKVKEEREKAFREAMAKIEEIKKQWNVEELQETIVRLKDENAALKNEIRELKRQKEAVELLQKAFKILLPAPQVPVESKPAGVQIPGQVKVEVEQPALTVEVTRKVVALSDKDLAGKIAILYASGELPADKWFTVTKVYELFASHGWPRDPRTSNMLDKFCQWGFFEKHYAGKRPEYRIKLAPEQAKQKGLLKIEEKVEG